MPRMNEKLGQYTVFASEALEQYDEINFMNKVLKDDLGRIKAELIAHVNMVDRLQYCHNKLLIAHAVTMFELDRRYQKDHGDGNVWSRVGSLLKNPGIRRANTVGVPSRRSDLGDMIRNLERKKLEDQSDVSISSPTVRRLAPPSPPKSAAIREYLQDRGLDIKVMGVDSPVNPRAVLNPPSPFNSHEKRNKLEKSANDKSVYQGNDSDAYRLKYESVKTTTTSQVVKKSYMSGRGPWD
jgi:hypothetical protein